jgi:hypothetical protein
MCCYLTVLAGLLTVAPVQACSTIYSYSASQPDSTTDWIQTFSLPQFDPALGELEAVHIEATFYLCADGTIFNKGKNKTTLSVDTASVFSLKLAGDLDPLVASVTVPTQNYKIQPHEFASYGSFVEKITVDRTFTGDDMAAFIGTGLNELIGSTLTDQHVIVKSGNASFTMNTRAGADLTIEYIDSPQPVPEPSTAGFAMVGLACYLGRRKLALLRSGTATR